VPAGTLHVPDGNLPSACHSQYNIDMRQPTHYSDIAPDGTVWWCPQCGRIAADRRGKMSMLGWSQQCTLLAVLVSESSMKVDPSGRIVQADLVPDQPAPLPGSRQASENHF